MSVIDHFFLSQIKLNLEKKIRIKDSALTVKRVYKKELKFLFN